MYSFFAGSYSSCRMGRARTLQVLGMSQRTSILIGSTLRPFHSLGANTSSAISDSSRSITSGHSAIMPLDICELNKSLYSTLDSSTVSSIKRKISSGKDRGSGVSTSSGHNTVAFVQGSSRSWTGWSTYTDGHSSRLSVCVGSLTIAPTDLLALLIILTK